MDPKPTSAGVSGEASAASIDAAVAGASHAGPAIVGGAVQSDVAAQLQQAADDRKVAQQLVDEADEKGRASAAEFAAARQLREEAAADLAAAADTVRNGETLLSASRSATVASPASAQLDPVPRRRDQDEGLAERVVVRATEAGPSPAFDPFAPLFPAKERVLPGNHRVPAQPAEQSGGRTASVRITDRVLHDGVLYEANTTAIVTEAQFKALRAAGATEGFFPVD